MATHPSNDSSKSGTQSEARSLRRLTSGGFELASYALILGAAGYGVDHWFGFQTPILAIIGLLVGFTLGFVRLIALANKLNP
ncbi:MAG: AtpZ/AtpI family protein [Planctomycetota bacterium]